MVADGVMHGVMRHTGTARLHREFLTAAFHSAQEVASPVFKIETRLISATVRPSPAVICLPACARLRGRVPLRLSINYEYSYLRIMQWHVPVVQSIDSCRSRRHATSTGSAEARSTHEASVLVRRAARARQRGGGREGSAGPAEGDTQRVAALRWLAGGRDGARSSE